MFLRNDHGLEQAGGTATVSFGRALVPVTAPGLLERGRAAARRIDWVPDLGARIGSADWWRGSATCALLCAGAALLAPGIGEPIAGATPPALTGAIWEESRAQAIAPLAWGAQTGRHMAANDLVRLLAEAPERPIEERTATVGRGGGFDETLQRAGLSARDADAAAALISGAMPLGDIRPGTQIPMTLGRRSDKTVARPLEALSFRARFDLMLSLRRVDDRLVLTREAIAVDHTPLRIQGLVGQSLYRSARAAGVPAKAVEDFIKQIAAKVAIGAIGADAVFDMTLQQERAATGEVQLGGLLFAGLNQGERRTRLVKWTDNNWYEASGRTQRQGMFLMPVSMARVTSSFGMRFHPLLGFSRMHKGIDLGAPWGTPIHAPADGVITFAGRGGGYGNVLKMAHGGGVVTVYGHLSRFVARGGERVARGDVIGYTGNSGLSTGPHLHWEVIRGGVAVNPRSFSFSSVATLSGEQLRGFKARVAALLAVRPGAR